ncbi:MAG: hypothetical protein CTY16_18710 [Methylobacter sp.]|nr:MAG: hypothetical protein CTY16_18710 [Methylobacter sp.]
MDENLSPKDLFLLSLAEKPSGELRKGNTWHIGNIDNFSPITGYFAVGRTTNSTIEKFDASTGNFIEEDLEKSPYTHCVFDARIGLIGIAKKTSLAPTSVNIAGRIEDLLSQTDVIIRNSISVEIRPIPDPEGFLKSLLSAYQVSSFTASFRGPNPFDADEHFQKPLAVYLSAANGEKGKAKIQGTDLNRKVLQEVTRSTAATGNEASARIKKRESEKSITISLKGDPVKRRYDEEKHKPKQVLADLTNLYHRIRNNDGN